MHERFLMNFYWCGWISVFEFVQHLPNNVLTETAPPVLFSQLVANVVLSWITSYHGVHFSKCLAACLFQEELLRYENAFSAFADQRKSESGSFHQLFEPLKQKTLVFLRNLILKIGAYCDLPNSANHKIWCRWSFTTPIACSIRLFLMRGLCKILHNLKQNILHPVLTTGGTVSNGHETEVWLHKKLLKKICSNKEV